MIFAPQPIQQWMHTYSIQDDLWSEVVWGSTQCECPSFDDFSKPQISDPGMSFHVN